MLALEVPEEELKPVCSRVRPPQPRRRRRPSGDPKRIDVYNAETVRRHYRAAGKYPDRRGGVH